MKMPCQESNRRWNQNTEPSKYYRTINDERNFPEHAKMYLNVHCFPHTASSVATNASFQFRLFRNNQEIARSFCLDASDQVPTARETNGSVRLHGRGTGTGNGKNGLLYIMLYCSHCTRNGNGTGNGKLYNGLWTHFSLFPYLIRVPVMHSNPIQLLCPRCNVNSTPHSRSRSPSPFHAV